MSDLIQRIAACNHRDPNATKAWSPARGKFVTVNMSAELWAEIEREAEATKPRWHVWFMYDNHSTAKVDMSDKLKAFTQLRALFNDDACGMLFVRVMPGEGLMHAFTLMADWRKHGKYIVLDEEIDKWLDAFYATAPALENFP